MQVFVPNNLHRMDCSADSGCLSKTRNAVPPFHLPLWKKRRSEIWMHENKERRYDKIRRNKTKCNKSRGERKGVMSTLTFSTKLVDKKKKKNCDHIKWFVHTMFFNTCCRYNEGKKTASLPSFPSCLPLSNADFTADTTSIKTSTQSAVQKAATSLKQIVCSKSSPLHNL